MGTRGLYVFCYKGIYYIWYNHCDSYFEGLGFRIVRELQALTNETIEEIKQNLETLNSRERQLDETSRYQGMCVATKEYKPDSIQTNEPHFVDDKFDVEYIYIVNLDNEEFKIYYTDPDTEEYTRAVFNMHKVTEDSLRDLINE